MAGSARSGRPLLALLLVALLLGLTAALLLAPSPASGGFQLLPNVQTPAVPTWAILALLGIVLLLPLVSVVLQRLRGGMAYGPGFYLNLLVIFGLLLLFVILFHLIHHGGVPATNGTAVVQNGSTCTPPATGCPAPPTGGGSATSPSPWYDAYLVYVLLIAAVAVAVVALPRLGAWWSPKRREPEEEAASGPSAAEAELAKALRRLEEGADRDPARVRIIRAYAELLRHVERGMPSLETATPREIEAACERRLRVSAATAHELTGLFEEARYAQRTALPSDAVARAEAALRRALDELRASEGSGP
jgi:phosphatidylglycerophosphate synthase